jgi:peptide/nickel transport system substrate-binding protein
MLYGVDATLTPRRQMVEAEEVSADGLTWTFRLRRGLRFHDGEAVLAKDAVASINRWAARDQMGQMIKAIENELVEIDDRTFRWVLNKPYPKMLVALGKSTSPCCFVMPARIAATDPFRQISEYVGSGPMRFLGNEWVPGAKAAFEEVRRLRAATGARVMARGRQADARGSYRMDRDPRRGHGRCGVAERRG